MALSKEQYDELVTAYAALALYDGEVSILVHIFSWSDKGWKGDLEGVSGDACILLSALRCWLYDRQATRPKRSIFATYQPTGHCNLREGGHVRVRTAVPSALRWGSDD
jgi:hypothetical protein